MLSHNKSRQQKDKSANTCPRDKSPRVANMAKKFLANTRSHPHSNAQAKAKSSPVVHIPDTHQKDKPGPDEIERLTAAYETAVESHKRALWGIFGFLVGIFVLVAFNDTKLYDRAVERAEKTANQARMSVNEAAAEAVRRAEKAADQADRIITDVRERANEELKKLAQEHQEENRGTMRAAVEDFRQKFTAMKTDFDQEREDIVDKAKADISDAIEKSEALVYKNELRQEAWELLNNGQYEEAISKWQQLADQEPNNARVMHNLGDALFGYAKECADTDRDNNFQTAFMKYKEANEAYENNGDKARLMLDWGNAIASYAHYKSGSEAKALLDDAYARYESSANLDPHKNDALIHWAIALTKQGELNKDIRENCFKQAFQRFKDALKRNHRRTECFNAYAKSLLSYSTYQDKEDMSKALSQAEEQANNALRVDPNYIPAKNCLANICSLKLDKTPSKNKTECERLFNKANQHYCEVISGGFESHPDVLDGLGHLYLIMSSKCQDNSRRRTLIEHATELYEWSVYHSQNVHSIFALTNLNGLKSRTGTLEQRKLSMEALQPKWNLALQFDLRNRIVLIKLVRDLCCIANMEEDQDIKNQTLDKATMYANKLEEIEKGSGAFYLACVHSMNREEEECEQLLRRAMDTGHLPTYTEAIEFGKFSKGPFATKDGCLEPMKKKEWFKLIEFNETDRSLFDIGHHYRRWRYRF